MRSTTIQTLILAALATLATQSVLAGDAAAGKAKAAVCAGCHGAKGISGNGMWPNLAGQKEQYLATQIKAIKGGKRDVPMMKPMVAGLSDTDIANLAAYFASLACGG